MNIWGQSQIFIDSRNNGVKILSKTMKVYIYSSKIELN